MLDIYPIILSFVADVAELTPRIAHHDPDLARREPDVRHAGPRCEPEALRLRAGVADHERGHGRGADGSSLDFDGGGLLRFGLGFGYVYRQNAILGFCADRGRIDPLRQREAS